MTDVISPPSISAAAKRMRGTGSGAVMGFVA